MHRECLFLKKLAHQTSTITFIMQFHVPTDNYRPSALKRGGYCPHGLISEWSVRTAERFWYSFVVFSEELVCWLKETKQFDHGQVRSKDDAIYSENTGIFLPDENTNALEWIVTSRVQRRSIFQPALRASCSRDVLARKSFLLARKFSVFYSAPVN